MPTFASDGDNVKVETPFGTVETTKDPQEAARNLGVDLYPGAQSHERGLGLRDLRISSHRVAQLQKLPIPWTRSASFYKSKFPNAMVTTSDANQCTIVSNDQKNMITINTKVEGDKTRIVISNVSRKSDAANSSSN